jgi:hypothetical protein
VLTVTVAAELGVALPLVSTARAVMLCEPFATELESQL